MCAKFGRDPTVVSKRGGGGRYRHTHIQTDKGTLQLYIVEDSPTPETMFHEQLAPDSSLRFCRRAAPYI